MLKVKGVIETDADGIHVKVVWHSDTDIIDRPHTFGWGLVINHHHLAQRLVNAINAGVVFTNPCLVKDIEGHTYVEAINHVYGRRMNADLKKLGY